MNNFKNYLKAVYYIETKNNLLEVAKNLVELETTGKWSGKNKKPTRLFTKCKGEVLDVKEQEKGKGYVSILYPLINFNMEKSAFSSVWLSMIGGATHALMEYEKTRKLPKTIYRERINLTIDENILKKFKEYCRGKNINMSKLIESHIKEELSIK